MITVTQKKVLKEIIALIKKGETITYGTLSEKVGRSYDCPRWLARVLGAISKYTYQELGVFMSVIVLNKEEGVPS